MKGKVVSVGPGLLMKNGERWPMPVKPGDLVIFHKNEGREVIINDEKLLIMRDDALLAVFTNPQEM
jgi:chaperonin GroES